MKSRDFEEIWRRFISCQENCEFWPEEWRFSKKNRQRGHFNKGTVPSMTCNRWWPVKMSELSFLVRGHWEYTKPKNARNLNSTEALYSSILVTSRLVTSSLDIISFKMFDRREIINSAAAGQQTASVQFIKNIRYSHSRCTDQFEWEPRWSWYCESGNPQFPQRSGIKFYSRWYCFLIKYWPHCWAE